MEKLEYFDSVREFWNRQFCTFEICKKLVELGFNEICLNRSDSDPDVLAILWQQAIDWIREKYDIHISYALQAQVIAYVLFQRKVLNRKVKS